MPEAMKKMTLVHKPHGFIERGGTVVAVALGDDRVTIADTIIRAVNAHDTLVEACEGARRFLMCDGTTSEDFEPVFDNLIAALKLAKG